MHIILKCNITFDESYTFNMYVGQVMNLHDTLYNILKQAEQDQVCYRRLVLEIINKQYFLSFLSVNQNWSKEQNITYR